jgi:nucleoside-diphosphate kinase
VCAAGYLCPSLGGGELGADPRRFDRGVAVHIPSANGTPVQIPLGPRPKAPVPAGAETFTRSAGSAEAMAEGSLERTLVLVKPDGVRRGLVGEILARFERKGLKLVAVKTLQVVPELAQRHYAEHQGKPFYPALIQHITSGPVVAMALEGRSAIGVVRLLTGATNPQSAAPGTIRGDYALGITPNLVHASDSPASAARELDLYFAPEEFLAYSRVGEEYF